MNGDRKASLLRRVVGVIGCVVGVGLMVVGVALWEAVSPTTHTFVSDSHHDVAARSLLGILGLGVTSIGWRLTGWRISGWRITRRAKETEQDEVRGTATGARRRGPLPKPKPYVKRPKDTSAMCECGHISYLHHGGTGKCTGADCKCAFFRVRGG